MKIAFLSFYSGNANRGVETYIKEISSRLKVNNEVVVYEGKALGNIFSFTLKILSDIYFNPDVIVATNGGFQSLMCKLWCLTHRKKLIIPGQSGLGRDDKINLLCHPDVFIALTKFQADWARKFCPNVRIEIIPNGVDLEKFNPNSKRQFINLDKPVILSVGAFTKEKRQDLIIKAVSKLQNASLLLIGKGPQQESLEKLADELLPNKFKILQLAFDKMPSMYPSMDVFTYATVPWESFGIVMVEAMASGLPVVATDDPIRREIVGDAGIFVNPEDTQEYAKVLQKALETKWEEKPRKQAEKYSWNGIAQEYEKLIQSLYK